MSFLKKIFKTKQVPTKPIPTEQNTPNVRPNIDSIPANELRHIILEQTDADYCLEALSKVTNEEDALTIAMQHPVAAVRNAAAIKINNSTLLQKLQTDSKGKDKTLYRLCKNRLAELREINHANQKRQERIEYLLSQARYLSKIGYQPEFSGKLQLLNQEWPELAEYADENTAQAMQLELQAAADILQQYAEEEAAATAKKEAEKEALETQQKILQQLGQLLEQAEDVALDDLTQNIQQIEEEWNNAFRQNKPSAAANKEFESNLQKLFAIQSALTQYQTIQTELNQWLTASVEDAATLQKMLKQGEHWLKTFAWPQLLSSPSWYQSLTSKLKTLKEQEGSLLDTQKTQVKQLEQQLSELKEALNKGLSKEASKLNRQIAQGLKKINPKQATQLQQQFRALQGQLQELRDWAGFATTPKKENLVSSMEELIGAELPPAVLAEKVQALQEEWKALSATSTGNDRDLWQSFNAAADKAFEPCKAYFAEQAKLRESYVELRHKLINELSTYELGMDWDNADWKVVQVTLDTARNTFRTYGPVERTLHKQTQDRFNEICDRIYSHLKQEYERNLALKQEIVQQAEQLVQSDDMNGIVNQVKALQKRWKEVGVTPRSADQKLWQQFRKSCDAIFARLDSQREERQSEISEAISTAEDLVSTALSAPADKIKALIREASQHIHSISLPKTVFQTLNKKLQDTNNELEQQAVKQQQAGLIARLEQLHADDNTWQQACALPLPKGFSVELFEQARRNELTSEDSAQDLCILLEIAKEQESDSADQARRMELQVQRLSEGLGKNLTVQDEVQSLVERWLSVEADSQLTQRFIKALQA